MCCLDVSADDSLAEEVGAHSSSATGDVGLLECSDQQTQTSSSVASCRPTGTTFELSTPQQTNEHDGDVSEGNTDSIEENVQLQPNQPKRAFPKKAYGTSKVRYLSFNTTWYTEWQWLTYDEHKEAVLCHPCSMVRCLQLHMINKSTETAFTETGFSNWKDARQRFSVHERSASHRESVDKWRTHINKEPSIVSQLSTRHQQLQNQAREAMTRIIQNVTFLSAQGLSLRGHNDIDSNFSQLLQLRRSDCTDLDAWLNRKKESRISYTSHDIQNELLEILSHTVLRSITRSVQGAKFFGLIADETTDCSRRSQLSIVLRWVDNQFEIHEDFVGFFELPEDATAQTLAIVLKDCLLRLGIDVSNMRGQCYDGASVMSGQRSDVAKRIADVEKRALFIHCCTHSLNLAVQDSSRNVNIIRDLLEVTKDVINFVHNSPKRCRLFDRLKREIHDVDRRNLRPLCPTRFTVRANSLDSLKSNYEVVVQALSEISASGADDSSATASGLLKRIESFDYIFALEIAQAVFADTDNLSRLTQSTKLAAFDLKKAAMLTADATEKRRTDDTFTGHFVSAKKLCADRDIDEPRLRRRSKRPARYEDGGEPAVLTLEVHYKRLYYDFLDRVINGIRERFSQPGFEMLIEMEGLLLQAAKSSVFDHSSVAHICEFYGQDMQKERLICDLEKLSDICKGQTVTTVDDIRSCVLQLGDARKLFRDLCVLLNLYFVLPGSSASAERSFSALRRLKNYLRSTMTAARLNACAIGHVHKDLTLKLCPVEILREFSSRSDSRKEYFGKV